jgi:hypothetical protein
MLWQYHFCGLEIVAVMLPRDYGLDVVALVWPGCHRSSGGLDGVTLMCPDIAALLWPDSYLPLYCWPAVA